MGFTSPIAPFLASCVCSFGFWWCIAPTRFWRGMLAWMCAAGSSWLITIALRRLNP